MKDTLEHLPTIDRELANKLAGGNPDFAEEMLAAFVKTLPDEIQQINQACANNDIATLRQQLHRLQGAVAYCGLPRLKATLTNIQTELRQNPNQAISPFINKLNLELEQVIILVK